MKLNKVFISFVFLLLMSIVVAEVERDERCPSINGDEITFLQHDSECRSFYICDNGWKVLMRCQENLVWNANRNYCDWPENVNCLVPVETGNADYSDSSSDDESSESESIEIIPELFID